MMRLRDITILATTKLRTRRIRTTITVVISGLLFACLIAALLLAKGAFNSIQQFSAQGLGSRYIVQAQTFPDGDMTVNKEVQARALEIYKQQVADKTAAAKKLGITYDATNDKSPVLDLEGGSVNSILDISNQIGQQAAKEFLLAHPRPGLPELTRVAASYHPKNISGSSNLSASMTVATMQKGVEDFSTNPALGERYQTDPLLRYQLSVLPSEMTSPFILPAASQAPASQLDSIPIVVSYSTAESILGLTALPKNASAEQQLDRLKELYKTAHTGTFAACYRNSMSAQQVQDAIATSIEITKNKTNKDYQKPDLIYGLPSASSCGPAVVSRDVRTTEKKTQDAKQKQFDAMFGTAVDPDQQKIEFRIVGLMPDAPSGAPSNSAKGILQSIVQSSLSSVIAVPQEQFEALPSAARYKSIFIPTETPQQFLATENSYVEFSNPDDARNFINEQSCNPEKGRCTAEKPFMLSAFGSNSIALRDLQRKFETVFKLAALAVVVIAIVIMTGTVGRMIADSRRETAVFRAVGAGRLDIASVYTLYAVLLSLCIAVFAVVLGVAIARVLDWHYTKAVTLQAQLIFGGSNLSMQFHLFQYDFRVLWVVLATIGSGLVSILLPLLRNIRRSPIKDMRDE